jgi:hypothetical protein
MKIAVRLVVCALVLLAGSRTGQTEPGLRVDVDSFTQSQAFTLTGATMDGLDAVHVWAFPENADPVFLGWAHTNQPYLPTLAQTGGWRVLVQRAPVGTYPIGVYAHDPATNTFPVSWGGIFTISACTGDAPSLLPWLGAHGLFVAPAGVCVGVPRRRE